MPIWFKLYTVNALIHCENWPILTQKIIKQEVPNGEFWGRRGQLKLEVHSSFSSLVSSNDGLEKDSIAGAFREVKGEMGRHFHMPFPSPHLFLNGGPNL